MLQFVPEVHADHLVTAAMNHGEAVTACTSRIDADDQRSVGVFHLGLAGLQDEGTTNEDVVLIGSGKGFRDVDRVFLPKPARRAKFVNLAAAPEHLRVGEFVRGLVLGFG